MIGSRKWLYILPNLFTLTSIFCGFYAMSLATGDATPEKLYGAALAILFGMLCDGLDGRVARLTRTQSDFGMQLDSLADVITFGAAPALLVWKWALAPLGFWGLFIAFAFAGCGALRLARFNVLEMRGAKGSSSHFVGLPIPLAAGVIVSLVVAHYKTYGPGEVPAALPVAVLVILLGYLMVSSVRYRTFKRMRLSRRTAAMFAFFLTSGVALTLQYRASFTLVAFAALYVFVGLAEEIIFFRRRREERLAARAAATIGGRTAVVTDDDDDDEDDR
ncbi:CDP-diacylglycerol--serine O-phosphatidyltransferase [Vulgatibacter sp.]|uniref:CDP-diacylglycerol--serine O-phosphatidyltransferase n=1 Tax=Vulgatibacter sp. TaxID=1971226 RepID=UPI0035630BF0